MGQSARSAVRCAAVVVIGLLLASCSSGSSSSATTEPLAVGQTTAIDGLSITVASADIVDTLTGGLDRGRYLVARIRLHSDRAQTAPYSPADWHLELADGTVLDTVVVAEGDRLEFGSLERGGETDGRVGFDVGANQGSGVLRYQGADGSTASWQVDLAP